MIFKLKLKMGGAGVRDADDVARLLAEAAGRVSQKVGEDGEFGLLRDGNGNRIGRWDFMDADPQEFVVGEEDNTEQSYGCSEDFYDEDGDSVWRCSRDQHTDKVHAAGSGGRIYAVWSQA